MLFEAQYYCLLNLNQAMTSFSVIVSQDHINVSGARLYPRELGVVCVGSDFDFGAATRTPCMFDGIYCWRKFSMESSE